MGDSLESSHMWTVKGQNKNYPDLVYYELTPAEYTSDPTNPKKVKINLTIRFGVDEILFNKTLIKFAIRFGELKIDLSGSSAPLSELLLTSKKLQVERESKVERTKEVGIEAGIGYEKDNPSGKFGMTRGFSETTTFTERNCFVTQRGTDKQLAWKFIMSPFLEGHLNTPLATVVVDEPLNGWKLTTKFSLEKNCFIALQDDGSHKLHKNRLILASLLKWKDLHERIGVCLCEMERCFDVNQ